MTETVLQFGGGKFLRSFADFFIHEANAAGQDVGQVVVVQSTAGPRAGWFNERQGKYQVMVRGLVDGAKVDEVREIASVSRALVAAEQWPQVIEVATSADLRWIISNVTEAGYAFQEGEVIGSPQSFPARLTAALRARFDAGLPGVPILPCELVDNNGERLQELVLKQSRAWGLRSAFVDWVGGECMWPNALVDRIVSSPPCGHPLLADDPLLAVAEPFALWAIEEFEDLELFDHAALQRVADVEPYALRKVRILNGAHQALVCKALGCFATVREAVADAETEAWLRKLLSEEIVPVVDERVEGAAAFVEETMQRFANPFLDHKLTDIAVYHEEKVAVRLMPTHREYCERFEAEPPLLTEILEPFF